jgi:hypothetical protein
MAFFRNTDLAMFRDDRALELEQFAEKANAGIRELCPSHEFLSDAFVNGGLPLQWLTMKFDLFQENLVNHHGNLDLMAGLLEENADLSFAWRYISTKNLSMLRRDVVDTGLHGIHFRMNLKNNASRMHYTLLLADQLLKTTYEKQHRRSPIAEISALTNKADQASAIQEYLDLGVEESRGSLALSSGEMVALTDTDLNEFAIEERRNSFLYGVIKLLSSAKDSEEGPSMEDLATRIEGLMIPLIYNFGYKLKAQGHDDNTVIEVVSRRIDLVLSFAPGAPAFVEALKRQILINLLSAFPGSLELLQAQPEELQGVMLNPVLLSDPVANLFSRTLAGPAQVFTKSHSMEKEERAFPLIDFLANTPYPLDLNIALHGYLFKNTGIIYLAHKNQSWTAPLEEKILSSASPMCINRNMGIYLSHPERIRKYTDPAVLKMIEQAIYVEVKTCKHYQQPLKRGPMAYESIAPLLKERPHLAVPVVQLMDKYDYVTPAMVEWCGIGPEVLKILGNKAPGALKKVLLESSLGL